MARATREEYPEECTHELVFGLGRPWESVVWCYDEITKAVWCPDGRVWWTRLKTFDVNKSSLELRKLNPLILENE